MKEASVCRIEEDSLSQDRMQFQVYNHYPLYPFPEKDSVKTELEHRLFAVFSREARHV